MVEPAKVLRGIKNLWIAFPPTIDPDREASNRIRKRELQSLTLGPDYHGATMQSIPGPVHPLAGED